MDSDVIRNFLADRPPGVEPAFHLNATEGVLSVAASTTSTKGIADEADAYGCVES